MKTTLKKFNDWEILTIEGTFLLRQLQSARQTFDYFEQRSGAKVALDLSQTKLLDSSAITLMMNFQKRLKAEGGRLIILEPSEEIKTIFDVLEIEHSIPVYYSRSDFELAVAQGAI
jgi:anti-anti-sigma factor